MNRAVLGLALFACALLACGDDAPAGATFDKRVLDPAFRAEGVAVFDVDRDGHADIVTDQYWYAGPAFTPHEIRTPEIYDPQGYSHSVSMWGDDLDGDGLTDLVVAPFPTDAMYWYRNPGDLGHWTPHLIAPALSAGTEQPVYVDLFGDGRRVLIMGVEPQFVLAWFAPSADPTAPWTMHPISGPGFANAGRFAHGVGTGDVDSDGRTDVLTTEGWFQQTANRDVWTFHAFPPTTDPCSTMFAYDFDRDGSADIVCAHPHTYGIDWWQQTGGTFVARAIDTTISQLGAVALDDLDGDGVPELVTGKNWWAHPVGDPGTDDPVQLVYYAITGAGTFARHDIDNDSGIGRQVTVADVDADGAPDIVTSTKKGLFVLVQR